MCMSRPTAPPPPPPPPAAPPVLEQDAPKLSDNDEGSGLNSKSRGLKNYKIKKRNMMMDDSNKLGGVMQTPKSNV